MSLPPLPEWSKQDDLGGLVPSEIRSALRAYGQQCADAERERCIQAVLDAGSKDGALRLVSEGFAAAIRQSSLCRTCGAQSLRGHDDE